jgi:rare lipoprotein A
MSKRERVIAPLLILKGVIWNTKLKNQSKYFLFLLVPVVFSACSSAPRFTADKEKVSFADLPDKENLSRYKSYPVLESVEGIASFYADKYHGRITYNGEVYDMNGISAAHQNYPMETIIRVTNLSNDKNVILRINDRMPYWEDRIIDLSLGTARELDFVEKGLTKVRIEVLKWGEGKK